MRRFSIRTASLAMATMVLASEVMATEWMVSLGIGNPRGLDKHVEKLAELVAKKTRGNFKLNISYDYVPFSDNLVGLSRGMFEMAKFCASFNPEMNPSITVLELPFLGVSSLEKEIEVSKAVYKHPATITDLARSNVTLLMPSPIPQYNIVGAGDLPENMGDFKRLKVRAPKVMRPAMERIGAEAVWTWADDAVTMMKLSRLDGIFFPPHTHLHFDTIGAESAEWWTSNLNPGTANCPVAVNTEALNALTGEEREALLGSVDQALDHYIEVYDSEVMNLWQASLQEKEIKPLVFDEVSLEEFHNAVGRPAAEAWVKENTELGLPAAELLELVKGTVNN